MICVLLVLFQSRTGQKNSDLSDVSKPLKTEKEKKNALADIDMNNYAGKPARRRLYTVQCCWPAT